MRNLQGNLETTVERLGFAVRIISDAYTDSSVTKAIQANDHFVIDDWKQDADDTISVYGQISWNWIVVDHYGLDARWESIVSGSCNAVMCIDDLANRMHMCSVLVDPTIDRVAADYSQWLVTTETSVQCGTSYAFIRDEFHNYVDKSYQRRLAPTIKNVMISLGGSDPNNITTEILQSLKIIGIPEDWEINVVVGNSSCWYPHVVEVCRDIRCKCNVLRNVTDMADLMLLADIAIGAGGGTTWERCYMGLPSLVVNLASNQNNIVAGIVRHGAAMEIDLDSLGESLRHCLSRLNSDHMLLSQMSHNARQLVDGKGVSRIVSLISASGSK
jgi:UDP-2,4-diacetamido-2,4,6-trideoxy-beta-L-altropyranose hydrolase